jgi:hypothetical protein
MHFRLLLCLLALPALPGCASLDRLSSPRAGAEPEAVLEALNDSVIGHIGEGAACTEHADAAAAAVADLPGYDSLPVYSCPASARAKGVCHVSLLVTAPDGVRYVLDNGSVIDDAVGPSHVARFEAFSERVDGLYWIGLSPDLGQVLAAAPDLYAVTRNGPLAASP